MKAIKKYIRELKTLLPLYGKNERRFVSDITHNIEALQSQNNPVTYELICAKFGTPQELYLSYYENVDSTSLISKICIQSTIKKFLVAILMAICITCFIKSILFYKAYQHTLETIPAYTIDIIE